MITPEVGNFIPLFELSMQNMLAVNQEGLDLVDGGPSTTDPMQPFQIGKLVLIPTIVPEGARIKCMPDHDQEADHTMGVELNEGDFYLNFHLAPGSAGSSLTESNQSYRQAGEVLTERGLEKYTMFSETYGALQRIAAGRQNIPNALLEVPPALHMIARESWSKVSNPEHPKLPDNKHFDDIYAIWLPIGKIASIIPPPKDR